jgi:hypothetical protein
MVSYELITQSISTYKRTYDVRFGGLNWKQFKFLLLDGSRSFDISESVVSIYYKLGSQRALVSQVKWQEKSVRRFECENGDSISGNCSDADQRKCKWL